MSRLTFNREVDLLRKYAQGAKIGIVEIGLYDGETSREMARASSVPLYGIDPIIPDSMPPHGIGSAEAVRVNMAEFGFRFKFYQDYSYNVVQSFPHPFDFIFVDGSHIYEDVKRDFEEWFTLLAPGGFIAFHDSAPCESGEKDFAGWPGCIQLTQEIEAVGYPRFVERIDTLKVFQK